MNFIRSIFKRAISITDYIELVEIGPNFPPTLCPKKVNKPRRELVSKTGCIPTQLVYNKILTELNKFHELNIPYYIYRNEKMASVELFLMIIFLDLFTSIVSFKKKKLMMLL